MGRSGMKQERERRNLPMPSDYPLRAPAMSKGLHIFLRKRQWGPEFKFEVVESTKDRCVGRTTQCPWHKRWKEQGVDFDTCGAGHQAWGAGATESLNPNFTFRLTKNMVRGDSHCEWVVERKK
jgi:L-2-amino-thiazoline-4-carboxylic acid hydrolase